MTGRNEKTYNGSAYGQSTLDQSVKIFRDMMAEARITSENITDTQQQETIYEEVTAIVQETIETIRNNPLPDTPTAQQLREEIDWRNRRVLPELPSATTRDREEPNRD